jgi:NADPH:quinone reductase-like Zn-dependent oxidoreductase
MKAIVCTKYGPPEVLQLQEVEKPAPGSHEVCIKVIATAVTASDSIVRGFKLPRWRPMGIMMGLALGFGRPRQPILGMVLAGEVDSVGKDTTRFRSGDPLFGFSVRNFHFGAYAEYVCLREDEVLEPKPANLTYEEAAAIPYGAGIALSYLRRGRLQSGQNALIYGASGAIGSSAVQLARYFGARVTGVCSTTNVELVKSLGADTAIDYTREPLPDIGRPYDLILDAVGKSKSSALKVQCRNWLASGGSYVSVDDGSPKWNHEDLRLLKELAEAGRLRPVIDRSYPLDRMAEAHQYVDQGHKKGNVVITVEHGSVA